MRYFLLVVGMLHLALIIVGTRLEDDRIIRLWMFTYPIVLSGVLFYMFYVTSKPKEPAKDTCTIIDVDHRG
jgi:hypothetical protein